MHMDETWVWNCWSVNTGVAAEGQLELRRGTQKGQRITVVRAFSWCLCKGI